MTVLNDELYFVAKEPSPYYKAVYKTDGTLNGTKLLFSDRNHPFNNLDIDDIITCGNYVYFGVQKENSSNKELWRTDGTKEGTVAMISEVDGIFNSINELSCFKDNLLFKEYAHPNKLWLTTGQVNKIYSFNIHVKNGSSNLSSFFYFTPVNDKIFFQGTTKESGGELYVTTLDLNVLNTEEALSINKVKDVSIMVFSNPLSNGQLHVKVSGNNFMNGYNIYNLTGKKIISKSNLNLSKVLPINVNTLSYGMYILSISINGKGKIASKFLVK